MPSIFSELCLNYSQAEAELDQFRKWVAENARFKERAVVRELKKYDHLCLLMSFLGTTGQPNLFKHEFELQGVFRADYVAGSRHTRHFTLVEFEGGEENSLFGPGSTNQMRDWARQVQHALGQIVDWSWALNDAHHSKLLQNAIGFPEFGKTYVVVCGLDTTMDDAERSRLAWLNDHCTVSDTEVLFMTFDDLVLHFEGQLDVYRAAREEARRELSGANNDKSDRENE
ncbi:MAG: Shedu anti-phage system protein SduA domain-containing protein [Rhodomicrobium sp.]